MAVRPGSRALNGPVGLAARLARRAAVGWIAGLAVGGLVLGLSAKGSATVWASESGGIAAKLGGAAGGAAYLRRRLPDRHACGRLAAAAQVGATREEEAEGYLDHLLARPVARVPWLVGRFGVSVLVLAVAGLVTGLIAWIGAAATGAGLGVATLLAAGGNAVPAGVFVLGAGTLLHGLAPRFAAVVAYAVVAWSFLVEIVGAGLGASRWLLDTSVLHHVAQAPAVGVHWDADVILVALSLAAAALGALAFARRDLRGA